jgi:hypothetical protein
MMQDRRGCDTIFVDVEVVEKCTLGSLNPCRLGELPLGICSLFRNLIQVESSTRVSKARCLRECVCVGEVDAQQKHTSDGSSQ